MKIIKRTWWVVVILVVAAGSFLYYRTSQASQPGSTPTNPQTARLSRGTVSSSVGATGTARSSQYAEVSWSVSGKTDSIPVKVGDQVSADQTLASLDTGSLSDAVLQAQQELIDAQEALEDLTASKVGPAQAYQDLLNAQQALDDAQSARIKLDYARATQGTIASAQANYIMAQQKVDELQNVYNNMSSRSEDDPGRLMALANLENAKKDRDKAKISLNWYKGTASEQEISEADAAVSLAQAKVEDAQRAYNRVKDGPTAEEISAAENRVTAAQKLIDSIHLTAPFDGTVTQLSMKVGDLVSEGTSALRLDDLSEIYIDLQVSEVDINEVQAGQDVEITFDAIPDQAYSGRVTQVGQIGSSSGGVVNFTVTVQVQDADASVKPGMTAAAYILTAHHEGALLAPSKSIQVVDDRHVLYVNKNGSFLPVPVETGLTSNSMTEILSGDVAEGDTILANPSSASTTAETNNRAGFGLFGMLSGEGPAAGPERVAPAGGPVGEPPAGGFAPPGGIGQ